MLQPSIQLCHCHLEMITDTKQLLNCSLFLASRSLPCWVTAGLCWTPPQMWFLLRPEMKLRWREVGSKHEAQSYLLKTNWEQFPKLTNKKNATKSTRNIRNSLCCTSSHRKWFLFSLKTTKTVFFIFHILSYKKKIGKLWVCTSIGVWEQSSRSLVCPFLSYLVKPCMAFSLLPAKVDVILWFILMIAWNKQKAEQQNTK